MNKNEKYCILTLDMFLMPVLLDICLQLIQMAEQAQDFDQFEQAAYVQQNIPQNEPIVKVDPIDSFLFNQSTNTPAPTIDLVDPFQLISNSSSAPSFAFDAYKSVESASVFQMNIESKLETTQGLSFIPANQKQQIWNFNQPQKSKIEPQIVLTSLQSTNTSTLDAFSWDMSASIPQTQPNKTIETIKNQVFKVQNDNDMPQIIQQDINNIKNVYIQTQLYKPTPQQQVWSFSQQKPTQTTPSQSLRKQSDDFQFQQAQPQQNIQNINQQSDKQFNTINQQGLRKQSQQFQFQQAQVSPPIETTKQQLQQQAVFSYSQPVVPTVSLDTDINDLFHKQFGGQPTKSLDMFQIKTLQSLQTPYMPQPTKDLDMFQISTLQSLQRPSREHSDSHSNKDLDMFQIKTLQSLQTPFGQTRKDLDMFQIKNLQSLQRPMGQSIAKMQSREMDAFEEDQQFGDFAQQQPNIKQSQIVKTNQINVKIPSISSINKVQIKQAFKSGSPQLVQKQVQLQLMIDRLPDYSFVFACAMASLL